MPNETAWLADMATAAERIARYIHGMDLSSFLANDEKESAVFGQLVIIGEAANRLSPAFCNGHPDIPWGRIVGLRNRIVHGYDEIDWEIVWRVAVDELPVLLMRLQPLIPDEL